MLGKRKMIKHFLEIDEDRVDGRNANLLSLNPPWSENLQNPSKHFEVRVRRLRHRHLHSPIRCLVQPGT